MIEPKFDEVDRTEVIEWYERECGRRLKPIGTKKKYLIDQGDRRYCMLGVREDWQYKEYWHGIDHEVIVNRHVWNDGTLIIAIRHKDGIDIYQGPLMPLILNKHCLSEGYTFHTIVKGESLIVKEIHGYSLLKIGVAKSTTYFRKIWEEVKDNPELMDKLQSILAS